MRWPVEAPAPAPGARTLTTAGIVGLGAVLPSEVVASDTIADGLGLAHGWIERRTGIASRRRAAPGDRLSDLAADAARAALTSAGIDATDVDTVLVATLAPD